MNFSYIYHKQREKPDLVGVLEKKFSKPYFEFRRRFCWICTYKKIAARKSPRLEVRGDGLSETSFVRVLLLEYQRIIHELNFSEKFTGEFTAIREQSNWLGDFTDVTVIFTNLPYKFSSKFRENL